MNTFEKFTDRLSRGEFSRIVAFGSSNTERHRTGMHWLDCVELTCRQTYGRNFVCINSGICGDTSRGLLERFERDCLVYNPNLVFITIGGNDAAPERAIESDEYRQNMLTLINTLHARDCAVVLQTYYSCDTVQMGELFANRFFQRMDTLRQLSAETGCGLIDHLAYWEPLRQREPEIYTRLMLDAMHVNELGNMVLGLRIARAFGFTIPDEPYFRETFAMMALMDRLS
jgi:lysophospholipase L1-like esterase